MDDNKIYITDENNNEVEMNILFTFEANEKNYVLCYENDNEDDLYPFIYEEETGKIEAVESQEELDMIDEVLEAFEGVEDEEND